MWERTITTLVCSRSVGTNYHNLSLFRGPHHRFPCPGAVLSFLPQYLQDGAALRRSAPTVGPIMSAYRPPNDLLGLAICEGVEDALTAHEATGLGAWAAGSAGRMPALASVIPHYIEALTIYAHDDKAGHDGAARSLTPCAAVVSKLRWRGYDQRPRHQ